MKEPAHLALHPFGQIPTYEEGDLALFETGRWCSISPSAMPDCCQDANARRVRSRGCSPRSTRWSRRSSSSQPPRSGERQALDQGTPAAGQGSRPRPAEASFRSPWQADWLDGGFSAGDLMMVSVLLRLRSSGMLDEYPTLPPISPAAKRGPPTSGLSRLNWRSTATGLIARGSSDSGIAPKRLRWRGFLAPNDGNCGLRFIFIASTSGCADSRSALETPAGENAGMNSGDHRSKRLARATMRPIRPCP